MALRVSPMVLKIEDRRAASATVLIAACALTSCSLLPPSLRGDDKAEAPKAAAAATPAAGSQGFGPAPAGAAAPKPVTPDSGAASAGETKIFKGTGMFVNPRFPTIPGAPGPQEASLNFEALDVREVAKVILGDYLKESYTVHPAVTGTVT